MKKVLKYFFGRLGYKITRSNKKNQEIFSIDDSYMITPKYRSKYIDRLSKTAFDFFLSIPKLPFQTPDLITITSHIIEFEKVYEQRPIKINQGGSRFHNCFWIFLFTKLLSPKLIVESGVWKGQTSWLMNQAVRDPKQYAFDINLKNLCIKEEGITYIEGDWSDYNFPNVIHEKSMCFFDCHINQAKRIKEAYDKGFKVLLFDDNPPIEILYAFGLPGLPTVDMLFEDLNEGEIIKWIWKGKELEYIHRKEKTYNSKKYIDTYVVFPNVGGFTKKGIFSYLSLVILK